MLPGAVTSDSDLVAELIAHELGRYPESSEDGRALPPPDPSTTTTTPGGSTTTTGGAPTCLDGTAWSRTTPSLN